MNVHVIKTSSTDIGRHRSERLKTKMIFDVTLLPVNFMGGGAESVIIEPISNVKPVDSAAVHFASATQSERRPGAYCVTF